MADLNEIKLEDVDIKLESSPHQDIPVNCKIFTQLIIDHYVFDQTIPVDAVDGKRENWKLKVNCKVPHDAGALCIAVLREGPPTIARLLGTIEIARETIIKASSVQRDPIAISLHMAKVNHDGPSVIVNTTFSIYGQEELHRRAPVARTKSNITLQHSEKFSLKPSFSIMLPYLRQMYETLLQRDEVDALEISLMHERSLLIPSSHSQHKAQLLNFLGTICSREQRSREISDLHRAIIIYDDAVREAKNNSNPNATYLSDLGMSLTNRYEILGDLADLDKSVEVKERAIELTADGDPDKASMFNNLGSSLSIRFQRLGDLSDLSRSVHAFEKAVELTPDGDPSKAVIFNNLGSSLSNQFERHGDLTDLNRSVRVFEQAVELIPDDHPSKPSLFTNFGNSLLTRFIRLGDLTDLNRSVQVFEQTHTLFSDGHPNKPSLLNNFGESLSTRFERLGDLADLNRSVQVFEQAVKLSPDGDPNKPSLLNNFGDSLSTRFERLGDLTDLSRSVQVSEEAVALTPDGHPNKSLFLSNLGNSLSTRFERLGDSTDLNRSVRVKEEAVQLISDDHPTKATLLHNLGASLSNQFRKQGDFADLNRSVQVFEQAVQLTSDGHSDKPSRLSNLGASLSTRFRRLGDLADVNRSVQVFEQAVELTPDSHSSKPSLLNNLGNSLSTRFEKLQDLADLNRSVKVSEWAVDLVPDHHPGKASSLRSLGGSLLYRFATLGDLSDLNRSVQIFEQAVALTPDGHPDKVVGLSNLGSSLVQKFENCQDAQVMQYAITSYSLAAGYSSGPLSIRFAAAQLWMKHSQIHAKDQSLKSCAVAMSLIPQLLSLGAAITDWHYQVQSAGSVARDAAAVAVAAERYGTALEWLEQGRSLVWNQLLQLHSPMDDLKEAHPELASKLQALSHQLEQSTTHSTSSPGEDQTVHRDYHEVAHQHEVLLCNIRQQKGFERFLLPKTVSDLLPAAKGGYIILLNARQEGIDALILHQELDVIHLPLPLDTALQFFKQDTDFNRHRYTIVKSADSEDAGPLAGPLSAIWHTIASRVLDRLQITTPIEPGQSIPRIWWCPTGDLSFLPIHAAGIYPNGPKLADFVVSSYTPTISALLDASHAKSVTPSQLLTVSLPIEAGLPATKREIECVTQHASGISVHNLCESAAKAESVSEEMVQAEWAHFACHGKQDPNDPTQSSLLLANHSKLRLSDIISLRLENAQLAFLSACETATGDTKLQDEAVHLAAGMLLAGYRGVIATMRSVDDEYAADIADETYHRLFEDYGADFTRAAEALHFAVQTVREEREAEGDFSFNWVPFIHMGI